MNNFIKKNFLMLGFTIAPSGELVQHLYLSTISRISNLRYMLGDYSYSTFKWYFNQPLHHRNDKYVFLSSNVSLISVTAYVI